MVSLTAQQKADALPLLDMHKEALARRPGESRQVWRARCRAFKRGRRIADTQKDQVRKQGRKFTPCKMAEGKGSQVDPKKSKRFQVWANKHAGVTSYEQLTKMRLALGWKKEFIPYA